MSTVKGKSRDHFTAAVIGSGLIDPLTISARCDCACTDIGLAARLERARRQQLRDHQQDGQHGVTNFGISMAASMAGVALAELLVTVCAHAGGSALAGVARRCDGELGCAAAALACAA